MAQRKTFDSEDEDINFELLTADKPDRNVLEKEEDKDSSDENDVLASDESDSAPEDIDFKVSRETTLSRVRKTMKQIEDERQKKKLKRKKQDKLFKEQKKKKLEELEKKRLPDDFLAGLSETIDCKTETSGNDLKSFTSKKATDLQERLSTSDSSSEVEDENEDFLPLAKGKRGAIQAVYVKDALQKPLKSTTETAAEFRRNALFGNKVKRESAKDMQRKRIKRKINSTSL